MKKTYSLIAFLSLSVSCYSQEDKKPSPFTASGFLEIYYVYDFNKPEDNTRPGFVYSHNRHNEVNINLGYVKVAYAMENVRANFALMTGTYANANLAAESGVLKNIYEANAGVKISSSKNLWVDAGVFPSHIGFESAHAPSCWSLTRSILADNTPYYESGAKISYTSDNAKWLLSGLILNGWQRIQRVNGNSLPSFGTQVTYTPNVSVTLNSSTFIGTDKPDTARLMRYFHNFYGIFKLSGKVGLTVGFDYGLEEKNPETHSTNAWFSPVVIVRFSLNDKSAIALRAEYYDDENGVIIPVAPGMGTTNGFKTTGLSANYDYRILPHALWRVEVRNFSGRDEVFIKDNEPTKTDTFVSTSLAITF